MSARLKATCGGTLVDIGINADCYVIEREGQPPLRVMSQRGILRALGANEKGAFQQYLARIPNGEALLASPTEVEFELPGGGVAIGRPAEWFVDVLRAYKAAWRAGKLKPSQVKFALVADSILEALAGVGLASLIDEATGYQRVREDGAVADLFRRLFMEKAAKWQQTVPNDLKAALATLYGVEYLGGSYMPAGLTAPWGWICETIHGKQVHEENRARASRGKSRIVQSRIWTEDMWEITRSDCKVVKALADNARDVADFKRRMLNTYNRESNLSWARFG